MEPYIPMSFLNDFIFCPRSIYFHQLYGNVSADMYHQTPQIAGKAAHATVDEKTYSTRKTILQGMEVYTDRYKLCGKIDLFNVQTGKLTERKREIKVVYDGYVFQVYAHYFALTEMGYEVKEIALYDMVHNKTYPIALPPENLPMLAKFEKLVDDINSFDLNLSHFTPNAAKCARCIYNNLCDQSLC